MGETINQQKKTKHELDNKLELSRPDRSLLQQLAVECSKDPTNQEHLFQYGFALSKCHPNETSELRYSIGILDSLVVNGFVHQMDCMYGAATALYLLKEYDECRTRCEAMLRTYPDSRAAKELHLACIEASEEQQREQLKTLALGSVAVAVGVGLLGIVGAALSKKK